MQVGDETWLGDEIFRIVLGDKGEDGEGLINEDLIGVTCGDI
jgi:hypothetical protein